MQTLFLSVSIIVQFIACTVERQKADRRSFDDPKQLKLPTRRALAISGAELRSPRPLSNVETSSKTSQLMSKLRNTIKHMQTVRKAPLVVLWPVSP